MPPPSADIIRVILLSVKLKIKNIFTIVGVDKIILNLTHAQIMSINNWTSKKEEMFDGIVFDISLMFHLFAGK